MSPFVPCSRSSLLSPPFPYGPKLTTWVAGKLASVSVVLFEHILRLLAITADVGYASRSTVYGHAVASIKAALQSVLLQLQQPN